ncbi:hypothetical protein MGSAQ_000779 [marine sediment metagenome]|uniref:Uncharacterized protein n=1 Tax=marine sediment metagenome TaxID=412755 RepID=A0A1B6NWG3_9ZZZZ
MGAVERCHGTDIYHNAISAGYRHGRGPNINLFCNAMVRILWCCALALQNSKRLGRVCLWQRYRSSASIYFSDHLNI